MEARPWAAMSENVDFSQRTADGPEDDASRRAEETIALLREVAPHFWRLHDPEELEKLKAELRDGALEEKGIKPVQPQERPKSQLQRDNEFWSSEEPKHVMPKKL
jgi:hypothetical protein